MKKSISILLSLLFVLLFFANPVFGQMDAAQRLAIVKALKMKGIVGENNKGYLEFRGPEQAKEVVEAENQARRKAYEAIAAANGVAVEQVGAQRAAQIAAESPAGTLIQLPDGRWVKK